MSELSPSEEAELLAGQVEFGAQRLEHQANDSPVYAVAGLRNRQYGEDIPAIGGRRCAGRHLIPLSLINPVISIAEKRRSQPAKGKG